MHFLILGGNSYIAMALRKQLSLTGANVSVFSRSNNIVSYANETLYLGDFYNIVDLEQCFVKKVDVVFHFILNGNPRFLNKESTKVHLDSCDDFLNLFIKNSVEKIIFPSSGSVYGANKTQCLETNPVRPISLYSKLKLAEEQLIEKTLINSTTTHLSLRIGNVYGPEYKKLNKQGLIPTIIHNIKNNIPIEVWGNGKVVRDYLYIDDLVHVLMNIIKAPISNTFNVGSGESHSVKEVIGKCFNVCKKEVPVIYKPACNTDLLENKLNIDLLKEALDWEPKFNLKDGVKSCWLNLSL